MSGSATNAGTEYQQRVAAWFLTGMLVDYDVSSQIDCAMPATVQEVAFETSASIDDLKLVFQDGYMAFLQIKRKVYLSDAANSDFVKTFKQFVDQFLQEPNEKHFYVLATPSRSSSKITEELRKILESIRLNDEGFSDNPLNESEQETLRKYRQIVTELYKEMASSEMSEEEFIAFSKKVHVICFDVEKGDPLETSAIMLLSKETIVNPELVWGLLVKNSLHYASNRQSISRNGLKSVLERYLKGTSSQAPDASIDEELFRFSIETTGDFAVGKEIVLAVSPFDGFEYVVAELFRFDDNCSKRLKFFGDNKCRIADDEVWRVIHRCSTYAGIKRFIGENIPNLDCGKLLVIPARDSEGIESTICAQMHAEMLSNALKNTEDLFKCLHCAKAITGIDSLVVELDDDQFENVIGFVHGDCLRPIDRVLGLIQGKLFEEYDFLKKFDVETWVSLAQHGQGFFNTNEAQIAREQVMPVTWNPDFEYNATYNYCVRINVEDKSSRYITTRGRIHRMSREQADRTAQMFNESFQKAKEEGDPFCYTSEHFTFGKYSALVRFMSDGEKCRLSGISRGRATYRGAPIRQTGDSPQGQGTNAGIEF